MNTQFIQGIQFDWNNLDEDSYVRDIQAFQGLETLKFSQPVTFFAGENGSGKSTLIKLLLKELDATSGSIIVSGEKLETMKHRRVAKYRRKLGVVFQDFRLLKDRNVYENVAFAQRVVNRPTRVIRKRVPEVLQEVGLAGKYKAFPDELSGGEQQRVALARAIVNRPDILLADEPTGNLDPKTSEEIMSLLEEINSRGTTVLVVTHNKDIVNSMKKRVLTMHNGVIISDEEEGEYYEDFAMTRNQAYMPVQDEEEGEDYEA